MKHIILAIVLGLGCGVIAASGQRDYCFKNIGLKVTQTISFTIKRNKVEGTMESGSDDGATSSETFDFMGTKVGSTLRIKFAGKPPYELPRYATRITWTMGTRKLRVPMHGKNYVTNRYSNYTATFTKCKEI